MPKKTCPLVQVRWQDSRGTTSNWEYLRDYQRNTFCEVVTVGYLIKHGKKTTRIAQSFADIGDKDMQVTGIMVIPTSCIISIDQLIEVE